MKKILLMMVLASAPLYGMEIPLEGFGKSANLAFVNIHKVFESFPDTEKARMELEQLISVKKDDITAKREEIAKLKSQIEFLKRQMGAVQPSTSTSAKFSPQSPVVGEEPKPSTYLTVPESSPLKFLFTPPAESTASADSPDKIAYSTFTKNAPEILPGIPSPGPSLMEREAELSRKQADLEVYIGAAEQEINQLEEGKTITLLARIYKTLEDISVKQGYTIVMDKAGILYGDTAIDITDQVINRLSSSKFLSQ